MKLKLILLLILFLNTLSTAQLLSEETNPEVNTKYKNHFNLIVGGDLILADFAGGHDLKAGIGYRTQKINYSTIIEYISISSDEILGNRETKITIIHPHFRLGFNATEKLEVFAFTGIGFGTFEASGNLKNNETLTGFGFGVKYYCFTISYREFYPASVVVGSIADDILGDYTSASHNFMLTLGFVIDMNLNKFFTDND